jgi:hypothetical protein
VRRPPVHPFRATLGGAGQARWLVASPRGLPHPAHASFAFSSLASSGGMQARSRGGSAEPGSARYRYTALSWLPVARNSQHFHFLELAPERAEDRSPQDPRCIISTLCSLPTRLSGCLAVQNNPSLFWHTPRELIRRPLTPSGETAAACDSKGRGKTRDALPPGQVWPSASQVS